MRETHTPNRQELFTKYMSNEAKSAFKSIETKFDTKTVRPYFKYSKEKNFRLKSLSVAKDRAYYYSIKTASNLFAYMCFTDGAKGKRGKKQFTYAFELLSSKGIGSLNLRASDIEARIQLTNFFMQNINALGKEFSNIEKTEFSFVTCVGDIGISDHCQPEVDLYAFKEKFASNVRNHSNQNVVGFAEIQPLRVGNTYRLMLHVHVVVWGQGWTNREVKNFKIKCKNFRSSYTRNPIMRKRMPKNKHTFLSNPSYISKIPSHYKVQREDGGLSRSEPMPGYLLARHVEILSQIPLECIIFSVREGKEVRRSVLRDLKAWDETREREYFSEQEIRVFWKKFWNQQGLDQYLPAKIRYKRVQN